MKEIRFYFHDINYEGDDKTISDFIQIFKKFKEETDSDNAPKYVELTDSKIHIQIMREETEDNKHYFFGKLMQSHTATDFKKESKGILFDFEIDDETGICQPQRGIIYFLAYFNETDNKKMLMVEDVPFALNIGGIITCLKDKLGITDNSLKSKQKLGRDIIPILNTVGESEITLARIRMKKNISDEDLSKVVVEDAFKKLKEEELDCELVLRWGKSDKTKLKDFLKKLFKIDNIENLADVDFGSFIRTLHFKIDNVSHPKINMKDDIIKYVNPQDKEYYLNHENDLYTEIKSDFDLKYSEGKLNG